MNEKRNEKDHKVHPKQDLYIEKTTRERYKRHPYYKTNFIYNSMHGPPICSRTNPSPRGF